MNDITRDPLALGLLIVLVALVPALGVWDFRRLLRKIHAGYERARMDAYLWTISLQWGITIGFLGWWLVSGRDLASIRLAARTEGLQWLVVGLGLVAFAVILQQTWSVLRDPEKLDQVRRQAGELNGIAPHNAQERRAFAGVSVTAGICEEILYRGLLLTLLTGVVGTAGAIVLSSVIFGLGHAYQGWTGIGKTALVGLALALLTVGTGSLVIPILLHTTVDLTSGHMLGKAVDSPALEPAAIADHGIPG